MADTPQVEVLLTRMEGKIDLLAQSHAHRDEHMKDMRDQVAKVNDNLHGLQTLNLPDRLHTIDTRLASHSDRLDIHDADLASRRGAVTAVRVVWALTGAAIAAGISVISILLGS